LVEVALQARLLPLLFLIREQKYLYMMKMREPEETLSSPFTDMLRLVAQPVGTTCLMTVLPNTFIQQLASVITASKLQYRTRQQDTITSHGLFLLKLYTLD
jgi:hypothetical protein